MDRLFLDKPAVSSLVVGSRVLKDTSRQDSRVCSPRNRNQHWRIESEGLAKDRVSQGLLWNRQSLKEHQATSNNTDQWLLAYIWRIKKMYLHRRSSVTKTRNSDISEGRTIPSCQTMKKSSPELSRRRQSQYLGKTGKPWVRSAVTHHTVRLHHRHQR